MGKPSSALLCAAVAVIGAGLHYLWPPLAVVVSFAAVVGCFMNVFALNVFVNRFAYNVACVAHFAAIYLGSGSLPLGLVGLTPALGAVGFSETAHRMAAGNNKVFYVALAAPLTGLALLAAAWPPGIWGWSVLPALAWNAFGAFSSVQVGRDIGRDRHMLAGRPEVGKQAEDFTLPVQGRDETFTLSAQQGGFVLLFFIRGAWCPFCHVLAKTYQKALDQLRAREVQVVVINPTAGDTGARFAERLGLEYTVLIDEGATVAHRYGILHSYKNDGEDVPLPISLMIDPQGVIRYKSKFDDASILGEDELDQVLAAAQAL